MVSNLSTIGFSFADDETFTEVMTQLASGPAEAANGAPYAVWRSKTGAEVWFHVRPDGSQIVGLTPFFEGTSSVSLRVTEHFQRPGDNPFEGAVAAWVTTTEDPDGIYPIIFDVPNFLHQAGYAHPFTCQGRITGFASQLRAFTTAAAYDAQQDLEPKIAPRAFMPIGMFQASEGEGENQQPPSSTALLTGTVLSHAVRTNEVTAAKFHVLSIATHEAIFDIVADPEAVEGSITVGGTIEVSCNLFGRLLD